MGTGQTGEAKWTSPKLHEAAGFTLAELMVVVAIAGILAAIAMPSFREFIAAQRVKSAAFDLVSMLTFTRSEALKRNNIAALSGIASGNLQVIAGGITIQQRERSSSLDLTCKSGGITVACTDVIYTGNGRLQAITPSIEISSTASNQKRCVRIDPSGSPSSKKGGC
jgi:type IV fimbrial biogenesis protein FimT